MALLAHVRESEADMHIGENKIGGSKIEPQQFEEAIQKVADFDGEHVEKKTQAAHGQSTDQHYAQHSAGFFTVSALSL